MPIRKGRWVTWDSILAKEAEVDTPEPAAKTFPREVKATKSRRTKSAVQRAARRATGTKIEIEEK